MDHSDLRPIGHYYLYPYMGNNDRDHPSVRI